MDRALDRETLTGLAGLVAERFGTEVPAAREPVDVASLSIPRPRVVPPPALAGLASDDPTDRYRHAHGQAFRDVVRALLGELHRFPDLVLRPATGDDIAGILEWCSQAQVACIPFGGGSSVVGGVEPPDGPTIALDLERMDRVLEVDATSLASHIQAGAYGPAIEAQLRPHGLTLRHFPQSWEFSTLGGWLATRAGGHFATGPTHIDDHVESISAITPAGAWTSRRLPASGAGPSPDRLLLGSEGTLGVITDAWIRVQRRPRYRSQATVEFDELSDAIAALRTLAQSGLSPANARLLDAEEARLNGAAERAVLVLGFESADHPQTARLARALELAGDHHGQVTDGPTDREGDQTGVAAGAGGSWRQAFLAAPYLRDALVRLGVIVETFETAITWDRLEAFIAEVREQVVRSARAVAGEPIVTLRFTHVYPDGAAPYFTVLVPGRGGAELVMWDEIKHAAADAVVSAGGTITHHHAVGRDHVPWYQRQRPDPFGLALQASKRALDPRGILNPGVLGL